MASSLNLPEKLFSLWTTLYSMEVFQSNYSPEVVEDKEEALKAFRETAGISVVERNNYLSKLDKLTARDDELRAATPEEVEEAKRRLRRRLVRTRVENT